ncbi:type III secretion system export apparatus subunit SctU [Halochromatium roseum]|uniref:type III secretion system export apparatus subunit SctU n=1 Tax=Halochromatium roseum TaxID=391920 RepID=UPI001911F6B6|nr:type III secretion system export apparatus subunit SctU [Halochromatium roseum]MBK5941089.1 EscU/YscU/HrcU family type III secretion system export apparatus switch protein [Halochromatium roseum]
MSGEKTEQPTPKKLSDARKKGQVSSSKDVVSAALVVLMFALLWGASGFYLDKLQELILLPTLFIGTDMPFYLALEQTFDGLIVLFLQMITPPLVLAVVVGIAAHLGQFGFLLAFESLKPDLNKFNPGKGLKKIFSIKNLVELLKSILKIALLTILFYQVISHNLANLLKLPHCGVGCVSPLLGALMLDLMIYASFGFILIAAADFAFQRFQFTKEMRMSKQEVKQEYKEMEGDPRIKGKRRQLHQELMMQNTASAVKRSSVVVTNPTRIAIALEYREGETPLPIVRAKGEHLMAQRIIEIARAEGIPVMENVPLARALHEQSQVDQYIPSDLIEAVAEVLRWVAQLEPPR